MSKKCASSLVPLCVHHDDQCVDPLNGGRNRHTVDTGGDPS